ncbi:hypothetical protein Hdeb2414_s0007g00249031 [Helianthus debilis subsp. tardiflorus]
MEWGIGLKFKPVAPRMDVSINQCLAGSIALYCRHFEFSNLRHPFSLFVLNVLEYYRVSFGQVHPKGMTRVLHIEVLCHACGYDPSLLLFRRFFCLAKNGDWFIFETSKVDTCLISSMVTMLGAWKERFFLVSDEILPFKMLWRRPEAILNEPEPSTSEINSRFLEIIRECPSRSDDTSDVAFGDVQTTPGENVVVKGSEQRFEGLGYVGVPDVEGFKKAIVPKVVRRSNRRQNTSCPPSTPEHVDLSGDIGVSIDHALNEGVNKEKELVIAGKNSVGKGLLWQVLLVKVLVVLKVLTHRIHEYEEFSKKKDKMKATVSTLKKENEGLVKKAETLSKKVEELTQRHEAEVGELKKQVEALEASRVQLSDDNKWLIEHGVQQVVTYLLHSAEFNSVLGGVYGKLLEHGRRQGYIAGYKACQSGDSQDKLPSTVPKLSRFLKIHSERWNA